MSTESSRPAHGDLLVTVRVAARSDRTSVHVSAQHAVRGDRVTAVTRAGGGAVTVAHLDLAGWPAELTRTATVAPLPAEPCPVARGLLVPWDLLVATAAARERHRPEVYDVLVARAVGSCRAGDRVLDLAGCHEQLRLLEAASGRMRASGAGVGARGRRLGLASWVLLGHGWHALVPTYAHGRAMVRIEPRRPADLAAEAARWLAAVRP